ncbi:hypothetical protein COT12_03170 [Candidatus Berkelbacteria bacterium CG08_land_8_20_14_0_20_39_8]|uniref:Uncharacterized protein n=1 Tax=Candidatus Berkelbacteria bacterium CG08_land_8_20_14_0_20_39_8 TaxID=1974511 RepID=A0A2M6YBI3_9BACT|nr:MAG: hypothetical protein COT12_03170 [Candidatus Berkelbacteria bacterium CG08_land_8_20_14_0_20_39_8]
MTKQIKSEDINNLLANFDKLKKDYKLDLSADEDLSIAIMNLVSIEEHFFFTAEKTEDKKYFDFLAGVREIRKSLLKKLISEKVEGEVWCISKHLLASSMRIMEVGTKELGRGKKTEAYEFFEKAYELYSLFWALNLKVIPVKGIKNISEKSLDKSDKSKNGVLSKFKDLVKKVIDCCIE